MSCCPPARGDHAPAHPGPVASVGRPQPISVGGAHRIPQATVPAGTFVMGDAHGDGYRADGELPRHPVRCSGFEIDATAVTTAAFGAFVAATEYVTDAEHFGSSAVFHGTAADPEAAQPVPGTPWWLTVPGARWDAPGGPGTVAAPDHPVVHVSHRDASAYCAWAGRSLPTEAQWEYAARGGLDGARYPWGDAHPTPDSLRCNIFRGAFPWRPTGAVGTVSVTAFEPNGFGLYQCVGNVWEWCADRFSARFYRTPYVDAVVDPRGPDRGTAHVLRGGSHLCHDSYCNRYRVAARSHNTPQSSASNIGFRTVSASVPSRA